MVGLGYVGLSNAIILSQNNKVFAVDIVKSKIEDLYDEADVVFEIEQDKRNPKMKYAINVAIKD